MHCWDDFLAKSNIDSILEDVQSKANQRPVGSLLEYLKERGTYFLKTTGQSLKMLSHAMNIADTILFNPE